MDKQVSNNRVVCSSGMYSSVILMLLLAQLGSSEDHCSKLKKIYHDNSTDIIEVLVDEQAVEIVVRGSGGAARAAAALLLVAIRHVRGYKASLNTTFVDLCDLLSISDLREAAVVAPAMMWPQKGCNNAKGNFDSFADFSSPAVVSYELRLWAYVPHSDSCLSQALQWSFYRNHTKMNECDFLKSNSIGQNLIRNYYAVLARNESSNDNEVATELQTYFQATNIQLQIELYNSDFLMRKKISKLIDLKKSFLFLDENLWFSVEHVINVQSLPCTNRSITCTSTFNPVSALRVGNGVFMKEYAPPISKLVNNFSPNASQLLGILEIETGQNDSHIEDAACSWALKYDDQFRNIISYNSSEDRIGFEIKIILCQSDPLNNVFENIIILVNNILYQKIKNIDYHIKITEIDCLDADDLSLRMRVYSQRKNISGVIAWSLSEGIISVAKTPTYKHLPLLLVGPVAPEVCLGPSVLAATGQLTDLTRALHYLFDSCEWSRIAILSDSSAYSTSFVLTLIKQKKLLYRNEIVNSTNINFYLDELKKADARIFLLNVNWINSCQILCAALKRGMTPTNGFVWIARDWRPQDCCNNNSWGDMFHYSINFGWQGEHVESGMKYLRNKLRNLSSKELYSDSSILADALLQLGYGFGKFHKQYPSYRYSLRSSTSTSKISKILENITFRGVAQGLKNENFTLKSPLIFINKWKGPAAQSVGVFRIIQNQVLSESQINATCETLFGSLLVRDRPHCTTIITGDPFSPRCQDFTVAIVTVLLLLFIAALYMARRNRLKRLSHRELNIMASLLEIRKHTASSLDIYLVNRNAIKLLHEIGSGTFGRVHFAELQRPGKGTVVVAAKEPRKDIGPTEECEFFHEACVLAPLCHDNIIRLVGICIMNGPPTVLMEHAFYLDLKRYLTERRHLVSGQSNDTNDDRAIEVSDESLTRLACEAAGALTYLTTRRLVHRDVRAANCLIDKKRSLKLGDFGMARELDDKAPEYATIRRALFPVLWMAPESLQVGVFSFATDIWALGVLITEVVTLGGRPYGEWQPSRVLNYVTTGGSPPLPPDVSKQTSSLLHSCWERKPELRPSASYVHRYLTQNSRALSPALLKPYPPDRPIMNVK